MDEDAALREVVKKALEGKGVLAQIRASLRAAVFTAVDEHERTAGIHVPNPAALRVKQDDIGRLSLQLVADFLEHWELHQTLSILKLETDLATEDLLSREELGSIVESHLEAGGGETKNSGGGTAPIILQLLAGCRAVSRGEENGLAPGARRSCDGGGVPMASSLSMSVSFRNDGGDQCERSIEEHKGQEEREGRWQEDEAGGLGGVGRGLVIIGNDAPPRVTLRKRRGIRGGVSSGGNDSGGGGTGDANEPALSTSHEGATEDTEGVSATLSLPSRSQQQGQQERDSDDDEERRELKATSFDENNGNDDGVGQGGRGRGGYHFDGGMDESSYDFSEDAVSVNGAVESAMGAVASPDQKGSGVGEGPLSDGHSHAAVTGNTTLNDQTGEAGMRGGLYGDAEGWARREDGDRLAWQGGAYKDLHLADGRSRGDGLRDGKGGGLTGFGSVSDGGGGEKVARSVDEGLASGGDDWNEDYYEDDDFDGDGDGDEEDHHSDYNAGGSGGGGEIATSAVDDEVEGEVGKTRLAREGGSALSEEVLIEAEGSGSPGGDAEVRGDHAEAERIADLEWESRVGLSADSSVTVDPVEGDDLDDPMYEVEDAQSV